ncbi:hypothetical protein C8Q73DRAFT_663304 [Cubamyces lactineus]|nr:hypothetical protein C8Q73DRAFT_663304 [Cubamyces lactineus]
MGLHFVQPIIIDHCLTVNNLIPVLDSRTTKQYYVSADHATYASVKWFQGGQLDQRLTRPVIDIRKYFPNGSASNLVHYDTSRAILQMPYEVHYCPLSFISRSHCNVAIMNLTSSPSESPCYWPGTVIVAKYSSPYCDGYTDFSAADIRNIRAYFRYFRWPSHH